MEDAKIYGLCLQRLQHQIAKARKKQGRDGDFQDAGFLLESYCTGDPVEIIDILELYDIENNDRQAVEEKLTDLAYTASVLMREALYFGYTEERHLGLYVSFGGSQNPVSHERCSAELIAAQR